MPIRIPNRVIQKKLWRIVGFISSFIGLLCYALSSSFKHLFGEWNLLKIIVYTITETPRIEDHHHVTIEVDTANEVERRDDDDDRNGVQSDYSLGHQVTQSLRRRVSDDEYNWRKYEEKQVDINENQTSYYKCTIPNCPVKKKVERTIDGRVIGVLYNGNHNHHKPGLNIKRNSSSEYLYSIPNQSFAYAVDI
ncbi:putative transcription factor WRKY family [Lupinus albus]|uniref:Putative transcription factor WRKY family n=1 Tax=Lupinus albus TaxID=3870 RepID=A0A6A4QMF1_LUPAL|nr:putative transcription factor WRKY family [Lupinus albus]